MEVDCIPLRKTGYFSELICDYLDEKKELLPFINRNPYLKNFGLQLAEKKQNYPDAHRKVLVEALKHQYSDFNISDATVENIDALNDNNTFTVTTGHQLNLFTGPLYFLYKIVSVINLVSRLAAEYPDHNFVPIYWMATEDHDFDEINFFNFKSKKVQWNSSATGAVGRMKNQGLEEVHKVLSKQLGETENAQRLSLLFERAYLGHETLADATRFLVDTLFGDYGLVIIDGDDFTLKRLLIPFIKKDIFEKIPFNEVSNSIAALTQLSTRYKIQVNPREINYFYLIDGVRERLVEIEDGFVVYGTELKFSRYELELELETHPERFSPNVIARPLYQEVILPNLCYIGGGGELAYWLEFHAYFERLEITFPILSLRNSVLHISEKQYDKIAKLGIDIDDLFLRQSTLINKKIRKISNIDIDFSSQKKQLVAQFEALYDLAKLTDKSFLGAVKAQEVKQLKGLEVLEKRLLKAQRRKLKDHVIRLTEIQNTLFPNASLQERQLNFSELYLEFGDDLIPLLIKYLDPLQKEFLVLRH
ncbi:MAG: bacillithiol biosynthesis cysteine-adding enzyme BshC [Bacteroidota bacterium]